MYEEEILQTLQEIKQAQQNKIVPTVAPQYPQYYYNDNGLILRMGFLFALLLIAWMIFESSKGRR